MAPKKVKMLPVQGAEKVDWLSGDVNDGGCTAISNKRRRENPHDTHEWRCKNDAVFGTGVCRFHGGLGGKPSTKGNTGLFVKNLVGKEADEFIDIMCIIIKKYDIEDEITFLLLQKAIKNYIKGERVHEMGAKDEVAYDAICLKIFNDLKLTPKTRHSDSITLREKETIGQGVTVLEREAKFSFSRLEDALKGEVDDERLNLAKEYIVRKAEMNKGKDDGS